jgi:phage N-6-adenine-methyltransferase
MSLTHTLFEKKPLVKSYPTPQWLFDQYDAEFHFTIDVAASAHDTKCARFYTIHDDGLAQDWSQDVCWCNPPWRGIERWVKKAYEESLRGATTIMLLPCRTDTHWWHHYIQPYAEIRWIKGRIKFDGWDDKVPFACAIFIFSPRLKESVRESRARGGRKAASNMSAEARKLRAQKAAAARWK